MRENDIHFPLAISTMERPRDQMSALTVYEVKVSSMFDDDDDPFIRSGCELRIQGGQRGGKMKTTAAGVTHSHITLAPNVGAGYAFFELPAYAEITEFNFAFAVDEDVGWLYVTVHDAEMIFEEGKAFGHG